MFLLFLWKQLTYIWHDFQGAPPQPSSVPTQVPPVPSTSNVPTQQASGPSTETPQQPSVTPTAKAKAKAKGGKNAKAENPKATWDLRKAKLSTLDKLAFPLVDRVETKKLVESSVLAKAGQHAKLCVQLKGHEASTKAVEDLDKAKAALESAWQDVKNVSMEDDETTWVDAMKACARMYIFYNTKEDTFSEALPFAREDSWHTLSCMRPASSSSAKPLRLKRAAQKLYDRAAKRPRNSDVLENAPEHLKDDRSYSNLEHMLQTPMAGTVLGGLAKKGADIKWLCGDVCGAAVDEGSKYFQTRRLSTIRKEDTFHRKIQKDLPKVHTVSLPVQVRKKLGEKSFSVLPD
ncbi:unnamed protein product [Symbiodinium sp. CCMP2592]|nr:unnamed protein product [Symbiodinium sp. CCMP2592]